MKPGWVLLAVIILAVVTVIYLIPNPRANVASRPDPEKVIRAEEQLLLRDARAAYGEPLEGDSLIPHSPTLAEPLSVDISGMNATLYVARKMSSKNTAYADVWYDVYRKYHSTNPTVCIHIVWKNGGFYQQSGPLDDIGWFAPTCPLP